MSNETEEDREAKEELSFGEIFNTVALNGEAIITIPTEEVERVKTGLKNFKAKQASKLKEQGLPPDPSVFTFIERKPEDPYYEGYTDLSIQLGRKSTVLVAKIKVPDSEF